MIISQKFKIVSIAALILVVVGLVIGVMFLFTEIQTQSKFIFAQSVQLDGLIEQLENKGFLSKPEPSDKVTSEYKVRGNALLLVYSDGRSEMVVDDVTKAGINYEICGVGDLYFEGQPTPDIALFVEGCGEMGGTMWAFNPQTKQFKKLSVGYTFGSENPSPNTYYQVILGEQDADNEVRKLRVKDFVKDIEYDVAPLPPTLSYVETHSELDGRPLGDIRWEGNTLRVGVFSTDAPFVGWGSYRLPVLVTLPLNN